MNARPLELEDYKTLVRWWQDNKFPPPTLDDLPMVNGKLEGFIVSESNFDVCAGFLIDTTVKNGCMIEYIVANFDVKDREIRRKSLTFLVNIISEVAKQMGKKYIFMSLKNQGLKDRLLEAGFRPGSIGTTEMIKTL